MMPRKKKKIVIITSIIFVIILIACIVAILYVTTDAFKANSTLFGKYISQGFQNFGTVYDEFTKNDYNELLKENKYTSNIEVKIKNTENLGTNSENSDNAISKLKLTIEGQTDKNANYNYQDLKLLQNDEQVTEVKLIQNDEVFGAEFSDFFQQYVVANNENLKELFEKLEFSSEQISKIPDKIDMNSDILDISDILEFSEEEKQEIFTKYATIITDNFSKNNFLKQSNQKIKIGEKDFIANAYILQLTKEQINNLYINILNELKQDEIILSKLDALQTKLTEKQLNFEESKNLKTYYEEAIQNLIEDITKTNIGQDIYTISVYESNNVTIKIEVKGTDYIYGINILSSDGEKYIETTYNEMENGQETTNGNSVICQKKDGNLEIELKNTSNGKESKYIFNKNEETNENNCNRDMQVKYEDESNRIEISLNENINIVQEFENELILNDENSVNLNDLTVEQSKAVINRVTDAVTKKYEEIKRDVIDVKDFLQLLVTAKLMKETQYIQSTMKITETEKARFNSKFEILNGENLDSAAVLNLINAVKDNLINLEVVSGSELKLILDRTKNDEEMVESVTDFIKSNKNKKYNATVEYDDETGLVKDILLTIIEKK